MMNMFNEKKTAQAASLLMHFRGKKEIHYIKLIKLLYLADREALFRWGRPLTYDRYVSMNHGPVLSQTFDLIRDEPMPGEEHFWANYFSEPKNYSIKKKNNPGSEELSDAEINLIKEIASKYGSIDRWTLINDVMHKLPEWQDPHGSAIPIEYKDILRASNKTPQEITSILGELDFIGSAKEIF